MLERLLNRRANETERFDRDGISITMTVGYTPDEVFIDGCKTRERYRVDRARRRCATQPRAPARGFP